MDSAALIETAKALVVERPSDDVMGRVTAQSMTVHHRLLADIGIWTHHIANNGRADYYLEMIKHQHVMTAKFHGQHALHFMNLDQDGNVDMFERCLAMAAFLQSYAGTMPTAFLDNDAFPNADLRPVFDQIQDIGLTARDTPGLMPVNEGVIFAKPTEAARKFFLSYLGTYERLRDTMAYDDWRWWGGQLALNAVAETITGPTVRYLPCLTYNFSPDEAMTREALDSKVVLHLKGPRKALFDQLVAYQDSRCA